MSTNRFAIIACGLMVFGTSRAADLSPVALLMRPAFYSDILYDERAADEAPFLFYVGEEIRVTVEIANLSTEAVQLQPLDGDLSQKIEATESLMSRGVNTGASLRLSSQAYLASSPTATMDLLQGYTIQPGSRLAIEGAVVFDGAPIPGVYLFTIATSLHDSHGRPVAPEATRLFFELRQPTSRSAQEVLRRQAMRAILEGRLADAERSVTDLVRLNPNSYAAFAIRGDIATRRGLSTDASTLYKRALDILERNDDREYLLWNGGLKREETINGLRRLTQR